MPEGPQHWTLLEIGQTHRQLPRECGPKWEDAVRRVAVDGSTQEILSDDYRPQNYCLGVPTQVSGPPRRRDIAAIFRNCTDGRKPDSRAVMSAAAAPPAPGASSFHAPAGPAEVSDVPAPCVQGPNRNARVMELDMGGLRSVARVTLR